MKNAIKVVLAAVALMFLFSACTRIETGHVGVRTSFNGEVSMDPLGVGFHQSMIGSIKQFVANEMTLEIRDLTPQTKDRTNLSDLDLTFTYSVVAAEIPELITKYKGRDLEANGSTYPVGAYVINVVQTATTDVISRYDALTANESRDAIRQAIKARADEILKEDGLKGRVVVHQVFIKNLAIAQALRDSAMAVITAQNALKAKEFEVRTAEKEADRMAALSKQTGPEYTNLLKAQADMRIAEAVASGKVNTIVIPHNFSGIVNVK